MENTNRIQYNAAAYVRLSKEDLSSVGGARAESNSISNQKQLILNFVKDKTDITIVSIREDDGYTGTDYDRPDFQRMMDDIRAGVVNCVIVKDLSRFGREYINAGKYIDRLFPYYGVRLISINDGIDTITRSSSDDFNIMVKNLMNDNYCRDISIKIRSQLQVKRKNGEFIGAFAPFGYEKSEKDKNQLVVDVYAAEVVRDIFRWKLEGLNQDAIARRLNEQGVLSPMEYKKSKGFSYKTSFKTKSKAQWTAMAVRRILTNPVYVGTLVQGIRTRPNYKIKTVIVNEEEKWAIYENAHEAIIEPRVFLLVQRLLELDTRTSPNEEKVFPLAGLLYCSDCKGPMIRKTQTASGKKFCYYVCGHHKKTGECTTHRISKKQLEEAVLKLLQEHIRLLMELDTCLQAIKNAPMRKLSIKKAEDRLLAVEADMDRYRRLKISAYEDLKDGVLSKDDYLDIKEQYEARIADAQLAEEQVHREINLYLENGNTPQRWIREFLEYRNIQSLTRSMAVECIESIVVYEDKRIELTFTHMQDYQALVSQVQDYCPDRKGRAKWQEKAGKAPSKIRY